MTLSNLFPDEEPKCEGDASGRTVAPSATLARFSPLMDSCGITRIANVTGLDSVGIPVALAVRPNSRSVAVSQGKGLSWPAAKASALMESIEVWHAENVQLPVFYGTARDLSARSPVVDIELLPHLPGVQRTASDPCLWVEGVELFSQSTMLVPFEMVHANYTRPIQPMHGMYPASTNGLASGNTHLEAICHALFEVIERDALAIWDVRTDADQATRRIELTTVRDDQLTGLVGQFASAGLECGLWDITTDNGLPTVLCIVAPSGSEPGHMGLGSGCHTSRTIAARRALMEAAQTRLNYISGSRDDLHAEEYGSRKLTSRVRAARAQLESSTPVLDFSSIPSRFHQAMRPELDHTLEAIRRTGLKQAIWVDLMQEALGVPVARLIVPGLEAPHDDPQYVPGERAMRVASDG